MTHRILVADDSPTIQKVIRIAFSRMEVEMIGASSYVEAVSEGARSRPSLVIVDAGLPGTRGPADFAKLKSSSGNVPVVLLVGSYENIDEPAFLAAGLEIIVRKPFDSVDLVKTCTSLLEASPAAPMPMAPSTANLPPPPAAPGGFSRRGDSQVTQQPGSRAPSPPSVPSSSIPEFDLGEAASTDMFRVTNTDAAARQAPATPTSARDIDLEQAIGSLGIPVIDMGSQNTDLPPTPATESGRRGQRAFSEPMPDTSPRGQGDSGNIQGRSGADTRASQHPATKTHYIPPPSSGGRGPTFSPPAPISSQASVPVIPASAPASSGGSTAANTGIPHDELARLVRESVEDYCSRNFSGLAREIIMAELRRLADDRARHLVDN